MQRGRSAGACKEWRGREGGQEVTKCMSCQKRGRSFPLWKIFIMHRYRLRNYSMKAQGYGTDSLAG